MRLTLRLLALALLVAIAVFANFDSSTSYANACDDGCWRGYQNCMSGSTPNQSQCESARDSCSRSCHAPLQETPGE
jgi:hypothetical protein